MIQKFRKFWKEWGMTREELLWFLLIPALSFYIFILVIIVLFLL